MGAKIIQDPHYQQDSQGREVFTLLVTKDSVSSFGRSYTIPELADIANTIITFLEKRSKQEEENNADIKA